tara:strand:- start:447 stop:1190 length:744 start_codon:yes stop_codon:yes gene_type:complete
MRTLVILVSFLSNIFSKDFDQNFNEANNYYNNSRYLESIRIYESILIEGFESSNLYYNLGNAYFRQNQIGQSIWSYNKALKMDPRNEDLIKNISIAEARIKDRVILPDEFYFVKIYGKFKSRYILKEWLLFGGIVVLLTVVCFLILEFHIINNLKIVRVAKILMLLTVMVHIVILDKFFDDNDDKIGIIIDNQVKAYSGPFYGDNSILFNINEGTEVMIKQNQKDWTEIILLDGKSAWITSNKIRLL